MQRFLASSLLVLLLLVLPLPVLAGEAVLSWTNPTQRTDGTALAAGEIAGTLIEYGLCDNDKVPANPQTATAQGAATSLTISSLGAGQWCFRASIKDTDGLQSAPSNVASKTIAPSPPVAPSNLAVSATTAYMVTTSSNFVALTPVGTVPLGASCLPQSVLGDYVVDQSKTAVSWYGSAQPKTVVAACSAP